MTDPGPNIHMTLSESSCASIEPLRNSASASFIDDPESRHELKILCRIIAAHHQTPEKSSNLSFRVGGSLQRFRVLDNVHIGQNVRCLIVHPECSDVKGTIFAFNWFSPQGIWDYCTLGLHWMRRTFIEERFHLCSAFAMDLAERFCSHPGVLQIFAAVNTRSVQFVSPLNFVRSSAAALCTSSALDNTTSKPMDAHKEKWPPLYVTGFSMGASIAHAFAVLLKERENLQHPIRCVGFGSPRPGNSQLTQWFKERLTANSLNVILVKETEVESGSIASQANRKNVFFQRLCSDQQPEQTACAKLKALLYDPVSLTPEVSYGYDLHPNVHIIYSNPAATNNHGIRPLTAEEEFRLRQSDTTAVSV